jgi:hypothetical protein
MKELKQNDNAAIVLGQKYAFATVALVLSIGSFISFLGMEKSILAIIFAYLALKSEPGPALRDRRRWGMVAIALGVIHVVLMPTLILLNLDKLKAILQLLMTLQEGK